MSAPIDRNQQTLNDISSLQKLEKQLFDQLETNIANGTLTDTLKKNITGQIEKLSQMRVNLYKFMNNNSQDTVSNLSASNTLLGQQSQTIIIVENELNESKNKLNELNSTKYNNLRMVEINKYYGDKYQDETSLMKIIVIICAVVILLSILHNRGIMPTPLYALLFIVVVIISTIILFWKIVYLYYHDKRDYARYDWSFNPSTAPKIDKSNPGGKDPWKKPPAPSSSGSNYCGEGTMYDAATYKCIPVNSGGGESCPTPYSMVSSAISAGADTDDSENNLYDTTITGDVNMYTDDMFEQEDDMN